MKTALADPQPLGHRDLIVGKAAIVRTLYEGRDISPLWDQLYTRATSDMSDAAAFHDLSTILYASGKPEQAASTQLGALGSSRNYRIQNGLGTGLDVLVFVTAGDFMANTPIEFLLEHSNTNILLHYVDTETTSLDGVPKHDVAFVGIGESAENMPVLKNLERLLQTWDGPILNNAPQRILELSRDGVAATFKGEPSVLVPTAARVLRKDVEAIVAGQAALTSIEGIEGFPIIIRPIGTHAGHGMEKIASPLELSLYLGSQTEGEFFVSPFIDYSNADGKFRKQRIAFINGVAFASHLAISDHWMVHYLSAGMAEHADRRAEEAAWMANFDQDFAVRHARSFDALYRRFGLDYFAIDCAELPDGRLLLFEADVAMIVHSMDSEAVFPYKKQAMNKIFAAFEGLLAERVDRKAGTSAMTCAHTGKAAVLQRTDDDCLICAIAMFTGRTYEEVQAIARSCDPSFPMGGPMSHSIMRGVANKCGLVLLSSIYMLWDKPAIIGVVSPTVPDTGHAVFWDGQKLIDPGIGNRVDRAYVDRCGLEFTQRATDLAPLIQHEIQISYRASSFVVDEPLNQ